MKAIINTILIVLVILCGESAYAKINNSLLTNLYHLTNLLEYSGADTSRILNWSLDEKTKNKRLSSNDISNLYTLLNLTSALECIHTPHYLFENSTVVKIQIEVSGEEWSKMNKLYDHWRGKAMFAMGRVIVTKWGIEESLGKAGIRFILPAKSIDREKHDKSTQIELSFDYFKKKRRFHGLEKLEITPFSWEPFIYYRTLEQIGYTPLPGLSFAIVSILVDGKKISERLQIILEPIDKVFIANHIDKDNHGYLWKGMRNSWLSHTELKEGFGIYPPFIESERSFYRLITRRDELRIGATTKFIDFLQNANKKKGKVNVSYLNTRFGIASFIKMCAVEEVLRVSNRYYARGENYYIYIPWEGKAWVIPNYEMISFQTDKKMQSNSSNFLSSIIRYKKAKKVYKKYVKIVKKINMVSIIKQEQTRLLKALTESRKNNSNPEIIKQINSQKRLLKKIYRKYTK